jgi:hypothetical protein
VHGKEKRGHGEGEGYTMGSTERFVVSTSASRRTDDDGGGLEKEKATGELRGVLATVTELRGDAIGRGSELTREESGRGEKNGLSGSFIGRLGINAGREGAP